MKSETTHQRQLLRDRKKSKVFALKAALSEVTDQEIVRALVDFSTLQHLAFMSSTCGMLGRSEHSSTLVQ